MKDPQSPIDAIDASEVSAEIIRKQNLFAVVWEHALNMKTKATEEAEDESECKGSCLYKVFSGDGVINSCFIGCTFPLSLYSKDMENTAAEHLFKMFTIIHQHYIINNYSVDQKFLSEMQKIHDNKFESRMYYLDILGRKHGLDMSDFTLIAESVDVDDFGDDVRGVHQH